MNAAAAAPAPRGRWAEAWPDALAFAGGLVLAWRGDWQTGDLIWSLWLSSLVVGYALIVWSLTAPLRDLRRGLAAETVQRTGLAPKLATFGVIGAGTLFGLVFFTVHFGGFHFVHSVFLNVFFPVSEGRGREPRQRVRLLAPIDPPGDRRRDHPAAEHRGARRRREMTHVVIFDRHGRLR